MLHIIILSKNYFPQKLNSAVMPSDKVVVIATPDGLIPVSAYKDESFRNMEVKLVPEFKSTSAQDEKNLLRITQAMLIGQLTAGIKDFEIYSDDEVLLKALIPYTDKKPASKKKTSAKVQEKKAEPSKEGTVINKVSKAASEKSVKSVKRPAKKSSEMDPGKAVDSEAAKDSVKEDAPVKDGKASRGEVTVKPAKLPTQAEVKRILGAANSVYAKPIMDVIKKSNQITFEMDLRMKLVEAGMEASQCQELAKTINEEFGKFLPASM